MDMHQVQLRLEPDKILRKSCKQIAEIEQDIFNLSQAMIACVQQHRGVGLAGPQVGIEKNIFVTDAPNDMPRVFINPTLVTTSLEEVEMEEGCLSIPTVFGIIKRSRTLTVQAFNERGSQFSVDADGMLARVILHELDHLKGILFWDYLPPKVRERLEKQYRKR